MRNLRYFCHYHTGDAREKTIKIAGSFFIATAFFTWGFSASSTVASEQYLEIAAELIPEASQGTSPSVAEPAPLPEVQPAPMQPGPTCRVNGTEMPGSCENYPPKEGSNTRTDPGHDSQDDDEAREELEKQMARRDAQQAKRDMAKQKKELNRLCNQLKRLKGTEDDLAQCEELRGKITEHEAKITATGDDTDALREAIEEYRDAQIWEELQKVRLKVELPKELNRITLDLKRAQRLLALKAYQKLGVDIASAKTQLETVKVLHDETKACYQAGDFECAMEKLQEVREGNSPGELTSVLQMLKGVTDMVRFVKDKELKAEIEELIQPVIDSVNAGEWRQAREDMEEINKELRDIMQKIMAAQKRKSGTSSAVRDRLTKLKEKYATEAAPGADDAEELPAVPIAPMDGLEH